MTAHDQAATIEALRQRDEARAERDALRASVVEHLRFDMASIVGGTPEQRLRAELSKELIEVRRQRDEMEALVHAEERPTRRDLRLSIAEVADLRDQLAAMTKERDEAREDGVLSQRVCDIENDRVQLQAERDTARAERDAMRKGLEALHKTLVDFAATDFEALDENGCLDRADVTLASLGDAVTALLTKATP